MTSPACSRLWQVEAARDGRLSGSDLQLAEHHREHCRACAEEARKLAALTQCMASLPDLPRDPLAVRRSRQTLLAAVNDSLLEPPARRSRRWTAALVLLPAAAGSAFLVARSKPPLPAELPKSAVEVRAKPGTRWSVHSGARLEQVELSDGEASFKVHPHADRRVLVRLPDGEIEDLGTTFEVAVHDQRTSHIAVTEGKVAVRLLNQPEFELGPGERWELPLATPTPTPSAAVAADAPASKRSSSHSYSPPAASLPRRPPATEQSTAPMPAPSAALPTDSTHAEDAAYLGVVSLLRQGHSAEARAAAKAYLLRFPSGFRRIEMLNVATSSDGEPRAK